MEEAKNKYKGGMVEEWNEKEDEEDRRRLEEDKRYLEELGDEDQDMSNLRDPYGEL